MNTMFKFALVLIAAVMVVPAGAEMNVDGMIKYRQSVMKSLGGHTGAMSRIVRGQVPMRDQLAMHATAARDIALTIKTLFPKDSVPPETEFAGATVSTEALASISEKPAEFEKAVEDTVKASEALLKVVKSGDDKALAGAFKDLGESCKGCHKDFREKKE